MNKTVDTLPTSLEGCFCHWKCRAFNLYEIYDHLKEDIEHDIVSIMIVTLGEFWMVNHHTITGVDPSIMNVGDGRHKLVVKEVCPFHYVLAFVVTESREEEWVYDQWGSIFAFLVRLPFLGSLQGQGSKWSMTVSSSKQD